MGLKNQIKKAKNKQTLLVAPNLSGMGHIVFGVDPLGLNVMLSYLQDILNKGVDWNQIYMVMILGHDEDLIRFLVTLLKFSRSLQS